METAAKGTAPIEWTPVPLSEADALIEARHGNIILSGVIINRDASDRPKSLVRVKDGHLVLHRCRLLAPGVADANGGGLIAFLAPSTQPLAQGPVPGPFTKRIDHPVCRIEESVLITGGDVLTADVGRGLIALSESRTRGGALPR